MKMTATLKRTALALALGLTLVAPAAAQDEPKQEEPKQEQQQQAQPEAQPEAQQPAAQEEKEPQKGEGEQQEAATPTQTSATPSPATQTSTQQPSAPGADRLESDDVPALPEDVPAETQAGRRGQLSEEEAAVLPYYNSFLTTYRLGPEDIISISIFGQERYSRAGITIPPHGRISYPLIPEGIFVAGKTTEQIAEEIRKRLDEYIIDPQVDVQLDKAVSAIYSVVGDVAQPGVRVMTRRYSITEALAMAGGVLDTGDKAKIVILRQQADGMVKPIIVNVKDIERGKAREMAFLVPGDQVLVPGNRLKKWRELMNLLPVLSFARVFTGGW